MVGSPVGTGVTGEAAPQASANSRGRVSSGRHFEAGGILKNVIFHQQIQADIIDKDLRSRLCRWQVFQLRFYSAGWPVGNATSWSFGTKVTELSGLLGVGFYRTRPYTRSGGTRTTTAS